MARTVTIPDQNTITQTFVDAIKANDESALRKLYKTNYHKIETLILKNNGTREQAKDIFQDAFIAVWKNIKNNRFIPDTRGSVNGYLYTIAKNKWMDYLRSPAYKKRVSYNDRENVHMAYIPENDGEAAEREKKLTLTMKAFEKLGEGCKSLLTGFYFGKKTMEQIAKELKMDPGSVRNKKYRCMQALRKLALEMDEE